ncbi:MAG: glutamate-cysteine ligase family protein [Tissierellia bacterium]|nr:glutamate-cysteine ligase family protein [Tissierellia bacterium]
MIDYEAQRDRLIEYFKSGEKNREEKRIGIEFEHFIIDKESLKSISYYGENGVEEVLKEIEKKGWEGYYNDDYLLGLRKEPYTISTEPAAQFELSIDAQENIDDLVKYYTSFMEELFPILDENGQTMIALGYHPVTKIDDITISPKKRYDYMYNYFKKCGETASAAHNMMKGTCAVQVAIDYFSEEDCVNKYRVGSALSPILYAMYDNSYIFESKPYESYNLRQYIWENTDKKRSGVLPTAFDSDFSYSKYADYILNSDIIFTDNDGVLKSTEGKLFKDIFDPSIHGDDEIYHAVSIVFPDLRLKRYLEFRMMDAVPYPLNFSAAALIKGLMYSEENLNKLVDIFGGLSYEDVQEAKKSTSKFGMKAIYMGKEISEWADLLIDMAKKGLSEEEKKYLQSIEELSRKGINPRVLFKNIYEEEGLKAAVLKEKIEVTDV